MKLLRPLAQTLLLASTALPATAGCSRPIQVPVAPIGQSVIVRGSQVSGIYPDILSGLSKQTGCQFQFSPVPRARLEALYEIGKADLLMPAPRTPRRDQHGTFVPLIQTRPNLIVSDSRNASIHTLAELKQANLRIAVVRGFDYGSTYHQFLQEFSAKGRVFVEVDALAVARLLHAGFADAAIMAPTVLAGAIEGDQRVAGLLERLHFEALEELDWVDTGVYVARNGLSEADQAELVRAFSEAARSSSIWDSYKRYYPAAILNKALRPRL